MMSKYEKETSILQAFELQEDGTLQLMPGAFLSDCLYDIARRIDEIVGVVQVGSERLEDSYILSSGAKKSLQHSVRETGQAAGSTLAALSQLHVRTPAEADQDECTHSSQVVPTGNGVGNLDQRLLMYLQSAMFLITRSHLDGGKLPCEKVEKATVLSRLIRDRARTERECETREASKWNQLDEMQLRDGNAFAELLNQNPELALRQLETLIRNRTRSTADFLACGGDFDPVLLGSVFEKAHMARCMYDLPDLPKKTDDVLQDLSELQRWAGRASWLVSDFYKEIKQSPLDVVRNRKNLINSLFESLPDTHDVSLDESWMAERGPDLAIVNTAAIRLHEEIRRLDHMPPPHSVGDVCLDLMNLDSWFTKAESILTRSFGSIETRPTVGATFPGHRSLSYPTEQREAVLVDERRVNTSANDFTRREGEYQYQIDIVGGDVDLRFEEERKTFVVTNGFIHLARLLQSPKTVHDPMKLRRLLSGTKCKVTNSEEDFMLAAKTKAHRASGSDGVHMDEISDHKALAEYQGRINEIDQTIKNLKSNGDSASTDELYEERQQIIDAISSVTGLGGTLRKRQNAQENAQRAVKKVLDRALRKIREKMPLLSEHFSVHLKSGPEFTYSSDLQWVVNIS